MTPRDPDAARLGRWVGSYTPPQRPDWQSRDGRYARLERLSEEHAEMLFVANAVDDAMWDYMPYGPFETLEGYRTWIASVQDGPDPRFYAVLDKDTGRALGVLSYLRIAPEAGSIEVGHIAFSPALQGTRIATEAIYLTLLWAFEAGYRRFEWKCNAANLPSRRAAERLGLSYEGVFRQAAVVKGRNRDTAWFATIDSEWPALKQAFETWLAPRNFDAKGQQRTTLREGTAQVLVAWDPVIDLSGPR